MKILAILCALLACLLSLPTSAALADPIAATAATSTISPVLERVVECTNAAGVFNAVWGYKNANLSPVAIPVGATPNSINKFTGTVDLGQPAEFLPGRQVAVFATSLPVGSPLVWTLGTAAGTKTATASSGVSTRKLAACAIVPAP
jgi:hypothetical protein